MADVLTREQRSLNMSRIRGTNTKPERIVRSIVHRMGYRFRIHESGLPGKPDLVLPRYRTVILVHGCFWHRHSRCRFATTPKTRLNFWQEKFRKNQARDRIVGRELAKLGWRVIVIWGCELRSTADLMRRLKRELPRKPKANRAMRKPGRK